MVLWCTCLKMTLSWKWLVVDGNELKFGTEVLKFGRLVTHTWGTFDLAVFKVIFGSFCALVSKWPVTLK